MAPQPVHKTRSSGKQCAREAQLAQAATPATLSTAAAVPEAAADVEPASGSAKRTRDSDAIFSEDDYMCPVCMDLLLDPVVGACGHDFCELCYRRWTVEQRKLSCPACRKTLAPELPGVCRRLQRTIEALFPQRMKERAREVAEEKQQLAEEKRRQDEAAAQRQSARQQREPDLLLQAMLQEFFSEPMPVWGATGRPQRQQQQQQQQRHQQQQQHEQLHLPLFAPFLQSRGTQQQAGHQPPLPAWQGAAWPLPSLMQQPQAQQQQQQQVQQQQHALHQQQQQATTQQTMQQMQPQVVALQQQHQQHQWPSLFGGMVSSLLAGMRGGASIQTQAPQQQAAAVQMQVVQLSPPLGSGAGPAAAYGSGFAVQTQTAQLTVPMEMTQAPALQATGIAAAAQDWNMAPPLDQMQFTVGWHDPEGRRRWRHGSSGSGR